MKRLIQKYWVVWLLFLLTLLPRVIFPNRLALIDDVRRDYGQAIGMLRGEGIPLLGIPSSVPRFSQGPLNIWFDTLAFWAGGESLYAPVFAAGCLVALGVVGFYLFLKRHLSGVIAFTAALLWVGSLAGIRQARLPFYLFAEPVFLVVYLLALTKLKNTWQSVFWATLSFFLLFQWELATIPLGALIIVALVRQRIPFKTAALGFIGGGIVGLLPQIIFDFTHQCRQVCGFGIWMGYRLAAVTGFDGRHGYSLTKFWDLIQASAFHLSEMVGLGTLSVTALVMGIALLSLRMKKKSELLVLTWIGTGLLVFGLFIHGDPSEAYFPPFIILLPILFGYGLSSLKPKVRLFLCTSMMLLIFVSVIKQIFTFP